VKWLPVGTVKRWLEMRGYGFIESAEQERDVFVHYTDIHGKYDLREGEVVEFDVINTPKGIKAINVTSIS
jgi:CspA family cold shock protein